jgi:hypothetical protein
VGAGFGGAGLSASAAVAENEQSIKASSSFFMGLRTRSCVTASLCASAGDA